VAEDQTSADREGRAPPPRSGGATALWLALVLLITGGIYARSLGGELVYDDVLLVGRNPYITDIAHIPTAFTRGYWDFLEVENAERIAYWRPLSAISMTLVWCTFGPSPVFFHAFCVLVHLVATAVCFFLARRLVGSALTGNTWIAGFTALFFGLHPTHVESVAWISALNDPLFGVFCLSSLLCFVRWRDRGSRGVPLLAAGAFLLGLLAKELAAATILLIVALDVGRGSHVAKKPTQRSGVRWWLNEMRHPLRAYAPFVLVLMGYLGMRMQVFGSAWAGFDRQTTIFAVGFVREWLLRAELLGGSISLLVAPLELNLFRPFRPHVALLDPKILIALGSIVAFGVGLYFAWKKRWRPGLFGLLLIPAGILPVLISIQSLGRFPLSDRFLYVPVFGFALAACLLLRRLPLPVAWIAGVLISGAYGLKSFERIGIWKNEKTLFERTAEQSPRSVYAQWGLGRVYLNELQATEDPEALANAFQAFERASDLLIEAKQSAPKAGDPLGRWQTDLMVTSQDFLQVNLGLAWCYILQAKLDPREGYATPIAILNQLITRVSEIEQQAHDARQQGITVLMDYLELEKLYTALGVAQRFSGDTADAVESFKRALSLQPNYLEAHLNYGQLLLEEEQFAQARGRFEKALELQPGDYDTRLLLARTLSEEGKEGEAEFHARELHELRPSHPEPMVILGAIRLGRGDASDALTWLEQATRADPRHGHAWYLKAKALVQRNAATEAIAAFRNAVRHAPNFENNYDFGAFLLNSGAIEEALPYLVAAYELAPKQYVALLRQSLIEHPNHSADTLYRIGSVDMRRGELDMAETFLSRVLDMQPNHGGGLLLMSRLLKIRGRHGEALDTLRLAVERMPKDFSVHLEYGMYLLKQGRFDAARDALLRAGGIRPPSDWEESARNDALKQVADIIDKIDSGEAQEAWENRAKTGG